METFRQNFNIVLAELVEYVAKNPITRAGYIRAGYISINKYKFWKCDTDLVWAIHKMLPDLKGADVLTSTLIYRINPKMTKYYDDCFFKRQIPAKLQIIHEGKILYERDWKPDEWVRRKHTAYINLEHFYKCPTAHLNYILPESASNQWKEYTLLKGFKKITVKGASGKGVAKETKYDANGSGQNWIKVPSNPFSLDSMHLWLVLNGITPKGKKYADLKQQVFEMCKVI
jgi:hypothetical protein